MLGLHIIVDYEYMEYKTWQCTLYVNGYPDETFYFHTKKEALECAKQFEYDSIEIFNKTKGTYTFYYA